jgi:hypothetical protein
MSALLCLVGLGCGPGLVRLSLFLGHVSLGFSLVPLCSAFVAERIVSGQSTRRFFCFAFDFLDNALRCHLRTSRFVAHVSLSLIDVLLSCGFGDDHSTDLFLELPAVEPAVSSALAPPHSKTNQPKYEQHCGHYPEEVQRKSQSCE